MRMRQAVTAFAIGFLLVLQIEPTAAQDRMSRSELRINDLRIRDQTIWYSGHWYHGWYEGRPGWWWVLGRSYYYYPVPVYPYPQVFDPPTAAIAPIPDLPTPAPAAYWNFCAEPVGYYPYVQNCATRWIRVVPTALPLAPPPPVPWPG